MTKINKEDVIEILKQCYDPEIPIDLWNLGLIYDISIDKDNVNITMSLTTPGCTMGQYMADDIKTKIDWGYAKDYVEIAHKIVQKKKPDFFWR